MTVDPRQFRSEPVRFFAAVLADLQRDRIVDTAHLAALDAYCLEPVGMTLTIGKALVARGQIEAESAGLLPASKN